MNEQQNNSLVASLLLSLPKEQAEALREALYQQANKQQEAPKKPPFISNKEAIKTRSFFNQAVRSQLAAPSCAPDSCTAFVSLFTNSFKLINEQHRSQAEAYRAQAESEKGFLVEAWTDSLRRLSSWLNDEPETGAGLAGLLAEHKQEGATNSFVFVLPCWLWKRGRGGKAVYHKELWLCYQAVSVEGQELVINSLGLVS